MRMTGGGPGYRSVDDNVSARTRHRLQQAVHAARYQHHDQETRQTEAGCIFVHGSARLSRLALHRHLIHGCQRRSVPGRDGQAELSRE